MHKKYNRILAIDPGSREMGLAVLDDANLVTYCVKSLKKYRPETRLKKAVRDIIEQHILEYRIQTIVIENGWFSQDKSPLFRTAFRTIEETAKRKKIPYFTYAPKTIRKQVCGSGKATKKRTARLLADRYSELEVFLEQKYKYKEKYWYNATDAIAAGVAHHELSKILD